MSQKIKKLLVINRGEIAARIIQSSQELGIKSYAIYSSSDQHSRHVSLADHAIELKGETALETYLNLEQILQIAKEHQIDAIHPGYGFLSERAEAAQACEKNNIKWIGPKSETIRTMGNKIAAKKMLDKASVPTLPWGEVDPKNKTELNSLAQKIGFPLIIKAASGGGGKGMRLVKKLSEIETAAESAAREAHAAFGDATLFLEKYLENPKHIEVQIFGDQHGNVIHLGERDCSAQRRHQKVIEEAPASCLREDTRKSICQSAQKLAQAVDYQNAGTIEFLLDPDQNFYFLELNSRLQVEHSVTEAVWGIDLVKAQIRAAQNEVITKILLKRPIPRGHAIEARIYAEDAANSYAPSPGPLLKIEWPQGPGIRVDSAALEGSEITVNYDPMIAKITVSAEDREAAIERLHWALKNTIIFGITTNINFLQDVLVSPENRKNQLHVKFLEQEFADWKDEIPTELSDSCEEIFQNAANQVSSSKEGEVAYPSPWERSL